MIKLNLIQQKKQSGGSLIFGVDPSKLPVRKIIAAGILFFVVDYIGSEWVASEIKVFEAETMQTKKALSAINKK